LRSKDVALTFPRIPLRPLQAEEKLTDSGQCIASILEFWQWAYSDLVSNATRGVLAEFIVARALGCTGPVRDAWDATDLLTPDRIKVEVKTSAYLQSWAHEKESRICFSIRPSRAWSAETNVFEAEVRRQADVYVFCLLDHRHKPTLNPLDLAQWKFFAVSAARLNDHLPTQKTVSLKTVKSLGEETTFGDLAAAVRKAHAGAT
jgi:hypothetical protein